MEISGASAATYAQSIRPQEPVPPPDGNIENRRPPPEPEPPTQSAGGGRGSSPNGLGQVVDISV